MRAEETHDREALFDLLSAISYRIKVSPVMKTILGESYLVAIKKTIDDVSNELFDDRRPKMIDASSLPPRFANIYCSQCGSDFGPGDHGYSACISHAEIKQS
jgi:hypothetical protein